MCVRICVHHLSITRAPTPHYQVEIIFAFMDIFPQAASYICVCNVQHLLPIHIYLESLCWFGIDPNEYNHFYMNLEILVDAFPSVCSPKGSHYDACVFKLLLKLLSFLMVHKEAYEAVLECWVVFKMFIDARFCMSCPSKKVCADVPYLDVAASNVHIVSFLF